MSSPISPYVLRHRSLHRENFHSDDPLPRFTVIPNFLRKHVARHVVAACQNARYATYCGYSRPKSQEVISEFCEPNERDVYVTVHARPIRPIAALTALSAAFRKRETLHALSELIGIQLSKVGGDVLTCWPPGSFLESHNDFSPDGDAKLILSLSLAAGWRASYGGTTVYAWSGLNRAVRIQPDSNKAVLFVPFAGSAHWVEQLSQSAPSRRRFTWTIFFR